MNIIIIGSWLGIISVRFIYGICLSGVAIEDILLLGDEQWEGYKQVKLVGVVLLIAGLVWLWSNMGVGLICLIICSIAFSTCETRSRPSDGGVETSNISRENTTRYLAIQAVKYLIRYMIGICWVWSHLQEWVLYILIIASTVFFVACRLRDVRATQDHNDEVVNTNDANSRQDLINRLLNLLCSLVIRIFLFYKVIIYVSRKCWPRLWAPTPREPPNGSTPDNRAPISALRDNEYGSPSSSHDSGNNFNVNLTAGYNENNGGTQTNGAVIVAKVIQIIHIVVKEGRSGCSSVLWLFVCLAIIYLFLGVTTTTTTSSLNCQI